MRRRLVLAVALLALAAAAPAAAFLPTVRGSALGQDKPLKAYASIAPVVHLFADPITARVAVVADTKWIDPKAVRVRASFKPYESTQGPEVLQLGSGRFVQITWTWTLRCMTARCVPKTPPSDEVHVFRFPPAHVEYVAPGRRFSLTAAFPAVKAVSQLTPGIVAYLKKNNVLHWQAPITPVAAPSYRVSPGLVFWLAILLAGAAGAGGLWLTGRWALSFRRPPEAVAHAAPATTLERALALFFWAREHGDETLQRKALERVADELPPEVRELSETAHALAWSPDTPEDDDVQALSEGARSRPEDEA
ncbi:MAG: hypothetical protein JOZ56_08325 [Actinobacteria bacterium]|nr:hypothetical protein [Actinomycetota bacterium]